jgi:hypothetical protein
VHLTDGDKTVDVGAAIQRVEGDDVSTLSLRLHLDFVIVFLDKATEFDHVDDDNEIYFKTNQQNIFIKMRKHMYNTSYKKIL